MAASVCTVPLCSLNYFLHFAETHLPDRFSFPLSFFPSWPGCFRDPGMKSGPPDPSKEETVNALMSRSELHSWQHKSCCFFFLLFFSYPELRKRTLAVSWVKRFIGIIILTQAEKALLASRSRSSTYGAQQPQQQQKQEQEFPHDRKESGRGCGCRGSAGLGAARKQANQTPPTLPHSAPPHLRSPNFWNCGQTAWKTQQRSDPGRQPNAKKAGWKVGIAGSMGVREGGEGTLRLACCFSPPPSSLTLRRMQRLHKGCKN